MKAKNLDLVLAALCSLVPLFWFSDGQFLKSEDLRLPYNWEAWRQLFYLWHPNFNTGSELILDNCLLPMMFLPALLQKWGVSLLAAEKILFAVWFALPGFSMAYLLRSLYRGPGELAFRVGAVSFYLFNLWLENVWIAFKPPLVTAYALVPLLLALIIRIVRGELRLAVGAPLFFFASFLASGMGNNSSEFGAGAAPGLILLASFFIAGKTWRNPGLFKHLLGRSLLLLAIWLVANFYWFLPQWAAIWRNVVLKMTGEMFNLADMTSWLRGVSQSTSFSNVIRTQADWTWYQGCVDPYRSYSSLYATHPLLVGLSWLIPAAVFLGMWNKQVRFRGYFIFLTLAGVFLSMGSHPPLGFIYVWMTEHIPLFWIFRSPYLKFYLWVCLGYAVFFGATCLLLHRLLSKSRAAAALLVALLSASNLVYAFPVSTGKMFHPAAARTFLPPNRFTFPQYVFEASDWLREQPGFFRFFCLPGDNPHIYEWGGTSFGGFAAHFSGKPQAFPYHPEQTLVAQGPLNQSRELLALLRSQIYNGSTAHAADLCSLLQIRWLLQEKDIRYDFYRGAPHFEGDSPEFVAEKIVGQNGIAHGPVFEKWEFHQVGKQTPLIEAIPLSGCGLTDGPLSLFTWWTYQNENERPAALVFQPSARLKEKLAQRTRPMPLLYSSDDLKRKVSGPVTGVGLEIKIADAPAERNGRRWLGWSGDTDKIVFTNRGVSPLTVHFSFTVLSLESPRSFYVRRGGDFVKIANLEAETPTEILVENLALPPGETEISFYSPFQHSSYKGKGTSFLLEAGSLRFGNLACEIPLRFDAPRRARVRIYPAGTGPVKQKSRKIAVEGKSFELRATNNGRKEFYEGTVDFPSDETVLRFEQEAPENDFVEISPPDLRSPPAEQTPSVKFSKVSPTRYKVELENGAPCVVLFSQSYHPCWKLGGLTPFKINGFANGYLVEKTGKQVLALEFTPQRLFVLSGLVTALGMLASLAMLLKGLFAAAAARKKQNGGGRDR